MVTGGPVMAGAVLEADRGRGRRRGGSGCPWTQLSGCAKRDAADVSSDVVVPVGVPTGNLVRGLYIEDLASAW